MKLHINMKSGVIILASVLLLILLSGDIYGQQESLNFSSADYYLNSNLYEQVQSYDVFEPRKPAVAFLLSAGSTAGAVFLGYNIINSGNYDTGRWFVIGGLLLGPSIGNIYAKDHKAIRNGVLIRLGGAAISIFGLTMIIDGSFGDNMFDKTDYDAEKITTGAIVSIGGAVIVAGSALFDIINTGYNVKEYNLKNQSQLSLTPAYDPVNNSVGFNLNYKF